MALPMAAWRLSYTSGRWLALSGPTSLVIMMAPPAEASHFVVNLWEGVLRTRTPDALFEFVSEVGIAEMPHFAAFFWDQRGLHGMARGDVRVLGPGGEIAVEDEGSVTWTEEVLDAEATYSVHLAASSGDEPQLPLCVGAALVSSVTLTTAKDQQLRFPDRDTVGALERIPLLGLRPRQRRTEEPPAAPEPAPEPVEADEGAPGAAPVAAPEPAPEAAPVPEPAPAPDPDDAPTDTDIEAQPFDPATLSEVASPVSPPEPEDEEPSLARRGILEPEDEPEPSSPSSRPSPKVVPGTFGEVEDDQGTIFSTGLAATHKPPANDPQPEPQLLAVPCAQGHPNPQGARGCRLCGAPVDSSNPRLVRRPVLAGVNTNHGEFADVVAGLVIGRAPEAAHGPAGAHLMRVPSPSNDISRNHLLVTANDWNIVVTDLHSTNGTVVRPPGEGEFELREGRSVTVEIGTILDLGDGVSLRIEPPRNA